MDVNEKKNKILEIIKQRGPSLPIHISRGTELSILFASAILSEMVSNKILKISNLKVGGSPLYYLQGQEAMLENSYTYLPPKEKEAFLLIKKNDILEDEKLHPAFRVALRNIKDFAVPVYVNTETGEKLFWYFHSLSKQVVLEKIRSMLLKRKKERKVEKKEKVLEEKKLAEGVKEKSVEKPKLMETEFIKRVYASLSRENIKIISEEEKKKKSAILKVLVNSAIGNIEMLAIAKDKKTITDNDIRLLLSYNQTRKLPILLLHNGGLSKKAVQEIENFKSFLFLKRLE